MTTFLNLPKLEGINMSNGDSDTTHLTTRLRYDSSDQLKELNSAVETLQGLPAIVDRLRVVGSEDADMRVSEILSALSRVATAVDEVTDQVFTPIEQL